MNVEPQIKLFAKKSGKSIPYVTSLWEQITLELNKLEIFEDEKRFYPYLTTKLKKKLGIKETSPVLMRFKQFLEENKK